MLPNFVYIYKKARETHHVLFTQISNLWNDLKDAQLSERVDAIYALRRSEEMLDDLRKEIAKSRKRLEGRVALEFYREEIDKLSTPYCSGNLKVSQQASFPHKRRNDEEAFDALMEGLGIPKEVVEVEAVRLNWEGFSEWFSNRQAQGLPVPKGIDLNKVYTNYEIKTRKKKDPDE